VWIQPLSVAYTALLGLPLDRKSRCGVAWYGAASLLPHLRQLVARGAIDVTVSWGDPIGFDQLSDRKAVAAHLERDIRAMTIAALRRRPAALADQRVHGDSDAVTQPGCGRQRKLAGCYRGDTTPVLKFAYVYHRAGRRAGSG
jgi:hypothetical protein